MTELERLSDHFIVRMYENLRTEVLADNSGPSRFLGDAAKQRAEQLYAEMRRRGLFCDPIEWR